MRYLSVIALILLLGACANIIKEDLGLARLSPNEKLVEQRPPLIIPDHIIN